MATRSPLKETDTNLKHPSLTIGDRNRDGTGNMTCDEIITTKKRALEKLDLQDRKRVRAERARSIEGAVKVARNTGLKNADSKVTPSELLEWQNNWKKIMRRESRIYFDPTDEADSSKHIRNLDKKKDLLKRGFLSLGAQITQFFDCNVTIVITRRAAENINTNGTDILSRAKKSYMKIWGYEKAARFLKNLDVDLEQLEKCNTAPLSTPTLSNLLQNEKLYGPTDRDPRSRREDVHYFKYAHVYVYDLWQMWAPLVTLEWKPQELADVMKLPYPILKMGTFGRCPFIGDGTCDESSYRRVLKRYNRDKLNKPYALKLRKLYQNYATPCEKSGNVMFIPHTCSDSKQCYDNWKAKLEINSNKSCNTSDTTNSPSNDLTMRKYDIQNDSVMQQISQKEKNTDCDVLLPKPLPEATKNTYLTRQETEEFPDDLCNSQKKSRICQEIKASGVHQSNDVATSFGNGLGPTTASVTNKNIKSLNRLVVDRKLGTITNPSHNAAAQSPNTIGNQPKMPAPKCANTKEPLPEQKKKKKAEPVISPVAKKNASKNAGYCENCRIKYYSLEEHVISERHQSFAHNSLNFEAIDSLIKKLKFQF